MIAQLTEIRAARINSQSDRNIIDARFIITGDTSQIDLPKHQKSGLKEAITTLNGVKGIGFVHLDGRDVIRHPLVKKIITAYEKKD